MDFNQKVNSLIESPVRPPLKQSPSVAGKQRQAAGRAAAFGQARAQAPGRRGAPASSAPSPPSPASPASFRPAQQRESDAEPEEPTQAQAQIQQQQQQQHNFDDGPVQTSTVQTMAAGYSRQPAGFAPQMSVTVHSAGGPDGASAITTQYDSLRPAADSAFESALDDSGANEDFRSAGAKAAASQNQNWYIMRSI